VFSAERGVTQGGPLSSLMFNVCVDAVIRHGFIGRLVKTLPATGSGIVWLRYWWRFTSTMGSLPLGSRDPVWLQESFDILVGLFERISLFTNAAKTKVMVCIPGRIQEGYTEEEYADYKSQTVTAANKKRCCVDCEICGASLAAGSYQSHL
jgi:hypothetical protein